MLNKEEIGLLIVLLDESNVKLEKYDLVKEKLEIMRDHIIAQEVAHEQLSKIQERMKALEGKYKDMVK